MSHSSARRAQVEPLPALIAVAVVCLAISAYAGVTSNVLPEQSRYVPSEQVLADAIDEATPAGQIVVEPSLLDSISVAPAGFEMSVTVLAGDNMWRAGATNPPPNAEIASELVPIRIHPGEVVPGRFIVKVWS